MGPQERKARERDEIKRKIIDAASVLIVKQGYEKLSIRKIAKEIEYTPGIIYHYFKDKQELLNCIIDEGYQKILERQSAVKVDPDDPVKSFKEMMVNYIGLMLENQEQFRAVLMNDIKGVEDKLTILEKGVSKRRKTLENLAGLIDLCKVKGIFRNIDSELTAQIIWTATHGLISRLVIEKNVSPEQKKRLINHHFDILMNGLLK